MSVLQPPRDYRRRYVRINPPLNEDPSSLDDVNPMQYIKELVRDQIKRDSRIRELALQLVATCFYFEKFIAVKVLFDNIYQCTGQGSHLAVDGLLTYVDRTNSLQAAAR